MERPENETDFAQKAKLWMSTMWHLHRGRVVLAATAVVALLGFVLWNMQDSNTTNEAEIANVIPLAQPVTTTAAPKAVIVHITGAIKEPGVYEMQSTDRVFQLVEAAGGFTELADKEALNLAQILVDGAFICIPETRQPARQLGSQLDSQLDRQAGIAGSNPSSNSCSGPSQNLGLVGQPLLVDPNTATSEDLQRLNGVGPSIAARILEYREANGEFRTAEDLLSVPGIGSATLERFRSQLSIS